MSHVFPGTDEERDALLAALARNCTCRTDSGKQEVCAGHAALVTDPRFVDGLLFVRRRMRRRGDLVHRIEPTDTSEGGGT